MRSRLSATITIAAALTPSPGSQRTVAAMAPSDAHSGSGEWRGCWLSALQSKRVGPHASLGPIRSSSGREDTDLPGWIVDTTPPGRFELGLEAARDLCRTSLEVRPSTFALTDRSAYDHMAARERCGRCPRCESYPATWPMGGMRLRPPPPWCAALWMDASWPACRPRGSTSRRSSTMPGRWVGRISAEYTFHERAAMLKELVALLAEHKDELYELSADSGATRSDAWLDIDGGMGVLASYASRALRELPNERFVLDGGPEALSRDGSFIGQHVRTPLRGAAVHINAFNFPCWGELEKFAPAFLAGVPVVMKPASSTAFVAERVVAAIVESDVLPPGTLQMVAGPIDGLLERLTGQDYVGFTGSQQTATLLRGLDSVRSNSVRFTAETDSLNSAILTLSHGEDSPEIDLFVDEIVKEIKAKSGQRCTAIRRAFVPESAMEVVIERLGSRIGELKVGDPRDPETDLGPLVSTSQVAEVDKAVDILRAGCELVTDPARFGLGGLHPDGAYYAPTVLVAPDGDFEPVHHVEPFGPVTTLIPYLDPADAVELASRGGGSLVASVFSEDPELARKLVARVGAASRPGVGRRHPLCPGLDRSRHAATAPRPRGSGPRRGRRGARRAPEHVPLHADHRRSGLSRHDRLEP
jgi:acyl-CoA reductase-like NAD-dependent aldehyde dehydrogenase